MPKKATPNTKSDVVHVRLAPDMIQRIDQKVENGSAMSRSEYVKEAVMLKLYIEEHRVAEFTLTSKDPIRSQDDRNTS